MPLPGVSIAAWGPLSGKGWGDGRGASLLKDRKMKPPGALTQEKIQKSRTPWRVFGM